MDQINKLSAEGLRVLAIAEIPNAGKLSKLDETNCSEILSDVNKYD
jgi:hypothetical protein